MHNKTTRDIWMEGNFQTRKCKLFTQTAYCMTPFNPLAQRKDKLFFLALPPCPTNTHTHMHKKKKIEIIYACGKFSFDPQPHCFGGPHTIIWNSSPTAPPQPARSSLTHWSLTAASQQPHTWKPHGSLTGGSHAAWDYTSPIPAL